MCRVVYRGPTFFGIPPYVVVKKYLQIITIEKGKKYIFKNVNSWNNDYLTLHESPDMILCVFKININIILYYMFIITIYHVENLRAHRLLRRKRTDRISANCCGLYTYPHRHWLYPNPHNSPPTNYKTCTRNTTV